MIGRTDENDEALDVVNGVRRAGIPKWLQNVLGFSLGTFLVALASLGLDHHDRLNVLSAVTERDIRALREDNEDLERKQEKLVEDYQKLLREFVELKANVQGRGKTER